MGSQARKLRRMAAGVHKPRLRDGVGTARGDRNAKKAAERGNRRALKHPEESDGTPAGWYEPSWIEERG